MEPFLCLSNTRGGDGWCVRRSVRIFKVQPFGIRIAEEQLVDYSLQPSFNSLHEQRIQVRNRKLKRKKEEGKKKKKKRKKKKKPPFTKTSAACELYLGSKSVLREHVPVHPARNCPLFGQHRWTSWRQRICSVRCPVGFAFKLFPPHRYRCHSSGGAGTVCFRAARVVEAPTVTIRQIPSLRQRFVRPLAPAPRNRFKERGCSQQQHRKHEYGICKLQTALSTKTVKTALALSWRVSILKIPGLKPNAPCVSNVKSQSQLLVRPAVITSGDRRESLTHCCDVHTHTHTHTSAIRMTLFLSGSPCRVQYSAHTPSFR